MTPLKGLKDMIRLKSHSHAPKMVAREINGVVWVLKFGARKATRLWELLASTMHVPRGGSGGGSRWHVRLYAGASS